MHARTTSSRARGAVIAVLIVAAGALGPHGLRAAISRSSPAEAWHDDPPTMAAAEALMQAGRYAEASQLFERLVGAEPENGVAWVRFGRALLEAGQTDRAIEVETKASTLSGVKARAYFNLACAHATKGDNVRAVEYVEQAVAAGLSSEQFLLIEPRLASLKDEPRFKAAIDKLHAANDQPIFHALDFWVGDWDVYDRLGNRVGTNRIESQESGCLIAETWHGTAGDSGRSMNFYVPQSSAWRQVWVNHVGDVLTMEGHVVDGAIWYEGESQSRRGGGRQNRTVLTALPGGRVRQTIHLRTQADKPWVLGFDCVYVPKGQAFSPDQFPAESPRGRE